MLTRILHNSEKSCMFLDSLDIQLSQPQRRHILNMTDALLVCEDRKTLAALQRQFVEAPDASNMADFLHISPWSDRRQRSGASIKQASEHTRREEIHRTERCAIPNCEGTEQVRYFELTGDRLLLRTEPFALYGHEWVLNLVWERAAPRTKRCLMRGVKLTGFSEAGLAHPS